MAECGEKRKGKMKPTSVNVLGKVYTIEYKDNPAEVDMYKRESLWGQIDYWTRTIRIYDNETVDGDTIHWLLHEILHAIASELNLVLDKAEHHDDLDVFALALSDVFIRNGWLKDE